MGEHGDADENSGSLSEERGVEVDTDDGRGGERRDFQAATEPPLKCKNPSVGKCPPPPAFFPVEEPAELCALSEKSWLPFLDLFFFLMPACACSDALVPLGFYENNTGCILKLSFHFPHCVVPLPVCAPLPWRWCFLAWWVFVVCWPFYPWLLFALLTRAARRWNLSG